MSENIKIIKTRPTVVFPQTHWNMIENDNQFIMEAKTEQEILEYAKENDKE